MLKEYQKRVIGEVTTYLRTLAEEQGEFAPSIAWMKLAGQLRLSPNSNRRMNGLDKDVPHFCLKVPTGGGKTLLATQVLGLIYDTILRDRNGAGLALWIVPSDQIYKDTLKALRDRNHFYRVSLEHSLKRPIEVWEKHEILRLTPTHLASKLNILMLILSSANREDKETLKMFRDSGGNIVMHFPPEDDLDAHRALREKFPNLEVVEGTDLVKTSVGNLLRLHEPAVILDEGHKAYSDLAQRTLNGFNPSIVVELSATPNTQSNVLCKVTGQELLDAQMIKLPINIAAANLTNWRDCLERALRMREELERMAGDLYPVTERLIRPIVLIQVERVGKDQLDSRFVHGDRVKEHLIHKCGVPENEIAMKTSVKDDIEGIDLLDEGCPIRFIITKAALQEGWDCPFAYLLVSLNNAQSKLSMTQLVGRILRQPYQQRTHREELNESYIYCLHKKAHEISGEVKQALEREGYEGDGRYVNSGGEAKPVLNQAVGFRKRFEELYRDFDGRIYLPRFCVKNETGEWIPLNYYTHLLSAVKVDAFPYQDLRWKPGADLEKAKEYFYRLQLGEAMVKMEERQMTWIEGEAAVRGWLLCNLGFEYLSHKQLRTVVDNYLAETLTRVPVVRENLALLKFSLRERIAQFIEVETDRQTQTEFERLFKAKRLAFYMQSADCRFQIPRTVQVKDTPKLVYDNNDPVQKSLFDWVPEDVFNDYEKTVALYLDQHPQVLWWYRNLVGQECFSVQGYRRQRIFPDFIAASEGSDYPKLVYVVESKGAHLAGNADTLYKQDVAQYFDRLGTAVTWEELGKAFNDHIFRFQVLDQGQYDQEWKGLLEELLEPTDR